MVSYILSLGNRASRRLPLSGSIPFNQHPGRSRNASYILRAAYTDNGGENSAPLSQQVLYRFRYPRLQAEEYDERYETTTYEGGMQDGGFFVNCRDEGSYLKYRDIDLTGIREINYRLTSPVCAGRIELRLDARDGPVVSTLDYPANGKWENWVDRAAALTPTTGRHDLFFVVRKKKATDVEIINLDYIEFRAGPVAGRFDPSNHFPQIP